MTYEIRALELFGQFCPAHTPEVFHTDHQMCLVVMQYLGQHQIMRDGLINAVTFPHAGTHLLPTFLANTLFHTSSLFLNNLEKSQLIQEFQSKRTA